jgi:hypothetical protein
MFVEVIHRLEADNWLRIIKSKFGLLHCTKIQKTLFAAHQIHGPVSAWWANFTTTRCHGLSSAWLFMGTTSLSYPIFMPKLNIHRMHDPGSIVPHLYLTKQNSGRLHNTTGTATGATRSQNSSSKNSNPSSPSEQQVWIAGKNSKVEYTYGWYSTSAVNK